MSQSEKVITRRDLLEMGVGIAVGAATQRLAGAAEPLQDAAKQQQPNRMIGIQIGAISFVDEGVNQVLDILQERGQVNTLFISSFTYDGGTGGRQVKSRPLPDHGKQEYDLNFHAGTSPPLIPSTTRTQFSKKLARPTTAIWTFWRKCSLLPRSET